MSPMTLKAKAAANAAKIAAVFNNAAIEGNDQVNALGKAMRQRKTYSFWQFDGCQVRGITMKKALSMTINSGLPSDEWAIKDDATGEIVVEKKAQNKLIPYEAFPRVLASGSIGHGCEEGKGRDYEDEGVSA